MKKTRGTIKIIRENKRDIWDNLKTFSNILIFVFTFILSVANIFDLPTLASENKEEVELIEITDEVIEAFNHEDEPEIKVKLRDEVDDFVNEHQTVSASGGIATVFETMESEDFDRYEEMTREPDISDNIYVPVKEERIYEITEEEYEMLCRIVEAEVEGDKVWYSKGLTYDDLLQAKIRVAQVFLNRTFDTQKFKSIKTLYAALTQPNATSTFNDGRYYKVTVRDITKEAVYRALLRSTPDYTGGALFFSAGSGCSSFGKLTLTDKVGHSFYNPYL